MTEADLELGNIFFNEHNKNQVYECPDWVVALLQEIERRISILHWNTFQKEWASAFENTGSRFMGINFEVKAYSWDEKQDWDFKYKDIEISWYKYLGRDTTININPEGKDFKEKIITMFNEITNEICLEMITGETE